MVRNMPVHGTVSGDDPLVERLRRCLPPQWKIESRQKQTSGRGSTGADLILLLRAPDGRKATVLVETKKNLEPMGVESALRPLQEASGPGTPMLYARFLSRRARERIAELGASYADETGNLRLQLEDPAVFIETQGAERDPAPLKRALGSLKGPAAGRVVRAACDFRPPYGVRELANRAGASIGSVARVFELLRREALVERDERGVVTAVDWEKLIPRWTQDYALLKSNRVSSWLAPRGLPPLLKNLVGSKSRYAVTGSFVAAALAPVAPPRLLTLYVDDAPTIAKKLDLRSAEAGTNVLLVEPFDAVVFDRALRRDEVIFANPSQVAADLLTGPGRAPAEADALLGWMKKNEDAWRS